MKRAAEKIRKSRKTQVVRDFGRPDEPTGGKGGKNVFLTKMKQEVYMKSTNINSLGERIGGLKMKFKRVHEMEERNLYKR